MIIPKIEAEAYYPYLGDFTHTYNGKSYYFDFVNESDIPQDIQIDSSIFDSVIQAELSMDSMRIAQQGYIISSISDYAADISSLLVNFALSSVDAIYQGFLDSTQSMLKWSVTYNGSTGTNRYSWTFSCPLGSQDIILGSDGLLPHPSDHTYTSHDDQAIPDIVDTQIDPNDGNVYIPSNTTLAFDNLKPPYIQGKSLYFTIYVNNSPYLFKYENFTNTILETYNFSNDWAQIAFWNGRSDNVLTNVTSNVSYIPGVTNYQVFRDNSQSQGYNHGISASGPCNLFSFKKLFGTNNTYSFNLPAYYQTSFGNAVSFYAENSYGNLNNSNVAGTGRYIFLKGKQVSTVTNPDDIVIPQDEPLPVDPIVTWPDDNLPDEDPDGDPVPVTPYDPEPINPVVPLPPIPSVVSGNDDLWPDLNDYFETEDNIIDFTFPAVNVEFPDLSILLGNFVNSFTWVSTIITALFNGSDFSVLFSVLAFFFIAAAVLGIYKWWK